MQLKNTIEKLKQITALTIPISNTARGEQIHQTFRNNLTNQLKEALYEDCAEGLTENDSGIIPYLTREGVILELPNSSVADNTDPDLCNGAISIELAFTFKSLDFDAQIAADEYEFQLKQKAKKSEEDKRKKEEKIARDKAARAAREFKRLKAAEAMLKFDEED